jgi:YidC/Oxa1 family membrane protein insertase
VRPEIEAVSQTLPEYQNPQQEPGAERRLMLVFLLTFVVLIIFQPLLKKPLPQAPVAPPKQSASPQPGAEPSPASLSTSALKSTAGGLSPSTASSMPPGAPQSKQAAAETETVIESDLYKITFSNRGAQVKSWILKKYNNDAQTGPLDLVNAAAAQKYGYPLSLYTYDEGLRNKLSSALYVASSEGAQSAPAQISFEYADADVTVRKKFRFDQSYVLEIETSVISKGTPVFAAPSWPAGFGDELTPASFAPARIDYHNDSSTERSTFIFPSYITRLPVKSVSGGNTLRGEFEWAGTGDQYFTAVFIPDAPREVALVTLRYPIEVPQKAGANETVKVDVLGAAVGGLNGPTDERMYVGPKELAALDAVTVPTIHTENSNLRGIVDFGRLELIARPLFVWLRWTYNHVVPNWGWAIVIQTLIIALALLPLRITQMKSMLKMQRVAPQIKSIQEKYKKYSLKDPRKAAMNEEISALYKKEGVNPAGGCLPLLIQMPFLFAYYSMLRDALDLRHAHWLWIHDLSARDPYFILPILMVISMFAMQKMTPQAGVDPAQQKMLTVMMPLMMGFIFFNLAAGLNLYYAESNLIQMAQQAVMNRTSLGREMREMMEKRARKKEK